MSNKPFSRKPPPLPAQLMMTFALRGIGWPVIRTTEALGLSNRFMAAMARGNNQRIKKGNPFRAYTPGPQDVFVMTMPKSGTNWTMQIVHQLIWHGKGEYNHIHDVVPWTDTAVMPGPMKNYAVPLDQATQWQAAPERKRVIKTHFHWHAVSQLRVRRELHGPVVARGHGQLLAPAPPSQRAAAVFHAHVQNGELTSTTSIPLGPVRPSSADCPAQQTLWAT